MWHLKVSGGRLVVPGQGVIRADVAIRDGRIATVGVDLGAARQEVDARGKVVFPGLIDPHIHLGNQRPFTSEAETEPRAAVAGGVTTVGVFLRSLEPCGPALPALIAEYEARARTDAFFHLQVFNDRQLDDLPACANLGVTSFKFYLYGLPGVIPAVDDGFLLAGFRAVAALGAKVVACVHAENEAIVVRATEAVRRSRPEGTLAADLAIVDLDLEREVRPGDLFSFSDFSPLEGRRLKGWAVAVIKDGQLAYRDGEILAAPGTGRYLARDAG